MINSLVKGDWMPKVNISNTDDYCYMVNYPFLGD
jgi:hypothetical protein